MQRRTTILTLSLMLIYSLAGLAQSSYQKPPKAVQEVLNAPPPPMVSISPAHDKMLLLANDRYPSIAEFAEPMLRLAGQRVNPNTNGPHRSGRGGVTITGLTLKNISDGKEQKLAVPANAKLGAITWAQDGKSFAVTNTTATGIELWIGDVAAAKLTKVKDAQINAVYGEPLQWMPDARTLLVQLVESKRGAPPVASKVPTGPTIQENFGSLAD